VLTRDKTGLSGSHNYDFLSELTVSALLFQADTALLSAAKRKRFTTIKSEMQWLRQQQSTDMT